MLEQAIYRNKKQRNDWQGLLLGWWNVLELVVMVVQLLYNFLV